MNASSVYAHVCTLTAIILSGRLKMTMSVQDALPRVFLIRGLAGGRPFYFSGGMDALARMLSATGIAASVHEQGSFLRPYGDVDAIATAAAAAARGGKRPILVGHSMGADAALKVAVKLSSERIAVPLVVCFDPTSFRLLFGPPPVPANVARALCFYQKASPLGRGMLKAAPGFKGILIQEQVGTFHSAIDDDPVLQQRVVSEVQQLLPLRQSVAS
jgi:pimeloyl-ACP methyl ester carboxylesterase